MHSKLQIQILLNNSEPLGDALRRPFSTCSHFSVTLIFMKFLPLLVTAFIIWLVPFALSFLFYDQNSQLLVSYSSFKFVMIMSLLITSFVSFQLFFQKYPPISLQSVILSGLFATTLNVFLDLFTVVPLANLTYLKYFQTIGATYVFIIFVCWHVGRKKIVSVL